MAVESPYGKDPERIRGRSLALLMAAYVAMIVTLAARHEMWRDEVRAFSVAIRPDSWQSMFHQLAYEGHPSLWYILLRAAYELTGSPLVLPGLALIAAAGTAYLILRFAPFSIWLRVGLVFGVYLGHELSVNARNYGIGVLLMITACIVYQSDRRRPVLLGLVLALLANTSVHAAIACLVIVFFWIAQSRVTQPAAKHSGTLAWGVAIALAGVAGGIFSASPSPDMAWAFSFRSLHPVGVLRSLVADPGWSLRGFSGADVAASGELPWRLLGIDSAIATRIVVDVAILSLLISLRKQLAALAAVVISILAFAFLFREVYSGSLRHQGVLFFLFVTISWMTVAATRGSKRPLSARRATFGLLPLVAVQAIALPVVAQRYFRKPESASLAFARIIEANPRYRNAILMGEPDYYLESMPYYVSNPVFMPRQNEFHYRVYFDKGAKRRLDMSLGQLLDMGERMSCERGVPVLLALGHRTLQASPSGRAVLAFNGATFHWTPAEFNRLHRDTKRIAELRQTTSEEAYDVFEVNSGQRCALAGASR